jgi:hypothetical protein
LIAARIVGIAGITERIFGIGEKISGTAKRTSANLTGSGGSTEGTPSIREVAVDATTVNSRIDHRPIKKGSPIIGMPFFICDN